MAKGKGKELPVPMVLPQGFVDNGEGEGKVIVNPTQIFARSNLSLTFEFKAGKSGIRKGGGIVITRAIATVPLVYQIEDWTVPQTEYPSAAGYVTAHTNGEAQLEVSVRDMPWDWEGIQSKHLADRVAPKKTRKQAHDELASFQTLCSMAGGPLKDILVKVKKGEIRPGEKVTVTYGDRTRGGPGSWAGVVGEDNCCFIAGVDKDETGKFLSLAEPATIEVLGGPPAIIQAFIPLLVKTGKPFALKISLLDRYANPAWGYSGTLSIGSTDPKARLPQEYTIKPEDKSSLKIAGVRFFSEGVHTIHLEDHRARLKCQSNPCLVSAGAPEYQLFFGDLHGHNSISDGLCSTDFCYKYARDYSGLDFSAQVIHTAVKKEQWRAHINKAVQYHQPGKFVTFSAYEWTSVRCGHKNVYFLKDDCQGQMYTPGGANSDNPVKLWSLLKGKNAFTIAHHPGGGPAATDWDYADEEMQPLTEIYSQHGNSEYNGAPRPLWAIHPNTHGFVQEALAQGIKVGIIADSDAHRGDQGSPLKDGVLACFRERAGLAAFYAKELTREALFEAIKKRRCYGTTGPRIILKFAMDGHMMGEEYEAQGLPQISVEVIAPETINKVEVLRNNQAIYSAACDSRNVRLNYVDSSVPKGTSFYYTRVTQADGEMAWSSPIWVRYNG